MSDFSEMLESDILSYDLDNNWLERIDNRYLEFLFFGVVVTLLACIPILVSIRVLF